MKSYAPRIEETADGVRIEFSEPQVLRAMITLAFFCLLIGVWVWSTGYLEPRRAPQRRLADFLVLPIFWTLLYLPSFWRLLRRYTVTLSSAGLSIRQEGLGMHWTSLYPFDKIQNLSIRYNPVLKNDSGQYELLIGLRIIPYPFTQAQAQGIRQAIRSRFPSLPLRQENAWLAPTPAVNL